MTCVHGLNRDLVDCLQCENEEHARERRTHDRRISPAIGEFAIQRAPALYAEIDRLREELRQCRSTLALAAESAAGDDELIANLVAALQGVFEHCAMIHKHWGDGDNSKAAGDAQKAARAALAKVQP